MANRGEIAVRVIRACRELGIATVAVHSPVDTGARHARLADEAYALSGDTAAESYLDTTQLVAAIAASGAEAVHPGYGFLAEDAAFARAVADAGAVFIGPPPAAIEMMGDKLSARIAAQKAAVGIVPGTTVALADASEVVLFGEAVGWPVAIKAAFGGGGRGIRVVASAEEAREAFDSAASEANAGFGHAECYVERYLAWPRHIEMQIFADGHGHCVWLGERECSIQRRHQKLIEEAPAPDFADDTRRAMGEAAVRVAEVAGYVGAGTVEFLYESGDTPGPGEDGAFWFLEMNTRLQVEHPVTEMVTGLDLVAEQIRVAAGAPLSFTQESVQRRGHAIECRLNAEDPAGGRFIPSPGTVAALAPPEGPGVRWDGGYEAGDTVSPFYDNLIGKLVVWAADRPAAIARMTGALTEMRLDGLPTTIPAHQAILAHPDFRAARHSTVWVEQRLTLPEAPAEEVAGRSQEVRVGGRWYVIPLPGVESRPPSVHRDRVSPGPREGSGTVVSQMQGTVTRVLVEVGDAVAAEQGVCAVEAMKMETVLRSGIAGTVSELRVAPGQPVRAGEVLAVIT
ncbi:MAG TPA: biotin carboxylase N-terminal domain-containing protein [Acidimicrobiia bacterium]|nr:biotin carboxylase N-terminal domain-containing protein [Acidimicrobiia bacterium]